MSPTPTVTKKTRRPVSTETPDPLETVQAVVAIPLDKLHRHPKNRVITAESVSDLMESLQEHGQRDPLRVRPLADPIGHYEILSGERRFVAATMIPAFETLLCVVERYSPEQSLIELAVANAARKDLNPIERGELLAELLAPEDEGGAGMERAAAGRLFGLNSDSGIKNALRLVKLPAFFRELLASGKISVAKARPLCAYPDALLEAFASWLQAKKETHRLERFLEPCSDEDADNEIQAFTDRETLPVDDQATANLGYQVGYDVCWLGELTDELRVKLQVVEIPNTVRRYGMPKSFKVSKTRLIALNKKEWEKINLPLWREHVKKLTSKSSKKTTGKNADPKKPPTAAELKAKRKKSDDALRSFTVEWQRDALRCAIAQADEPSRELMFWLFSRYGGGLAYRDPKLSDIFEWSLVDVGLSAHDNTPARIEELGSTSCLIWNAYRLLLWPVASHDKSHGDLTAPGLLPDALPALDGLIVDELAEVVGVSMETVWRDARSGVDFSAETNTLREMVRKWLGRHTKEQLVDLAAELGVTLIDGRRDEMVDGLLALHTTAAKKSLKLPTAFAKPSRVGGKRK